MHLVGNSLNGRYPTELVRLADCDGLEQIDLAVAYVSEMDEIFDLAKKRRVPLNLYAIADGYGFPNLGVARKFIQSRRASWRLFLTRDFFHPKLMWFRGVGAYIGSANLSGKAWAQNQECGIWLAQGDIERLGWDIELVSILQAVHGHCREAISEDLKALETLESQRSRFDKAKREFKKDIDLLLGRLPGTKSPLDQTKRREPGGAAKKAFIEDWDKALTILRKIAQLFAHHRQEWPDWIDRDAAPAIVQDQATEWWWETQFRHTGESREKMLEAHQKNSRNPDAAVQDILRNWCQFDGGRDELWSNNVNRHPKELNHLLSRENLRQLDEKKLSRVLFLCHASREHIRYFSSEFGLKPNDNLSSEEKCAHFANYLMNGVYQRAVVEVLEFVLWGDKISGSQNRSSAARIWMAANDKEWKLPHLGPHIFGELLGYTRPDEFPPRNNRVSKTLYALGFSGIRYV